MKKMIAMLLALCLLTALSACGGREERQTLGGWTLTEDGAVSERAQKAFDKATDGIAGASYQPVALLGTQVVSGMNYCFLCEVMLYTDRVDACSLYYAVVTVYENAQGEAEILNTVPLDLGQILESGAVEQTDSALAPMLGSWQMDRESSVEAEDAVLHLASQPVSGTNHCVLCKGWKLCYIYEDLEGKTETLKTVDLDLGALSRPAQN